MKSEEFKEAVFGEFAKIGQALSSPKRLEILDILAQGERDVESLSKECGLSTANGSRHLQVLKVAHLVSSRKDGVKVLYRLSDPQVFRCLKNLELLAENLLPEVKEAIRLYNSAREEMESISADELLRRINEGGVVLLDVRPKAEYEMGHIAEALSIPLDELKERLPEISLDATVVAYCRGPYCVLADEAVSVLRSAGIHAKRLKEGFPEWKAAGLPVE
ncbi:MAG: metalloregulator ArsR/SmtB family transcription factor [Myxococcota bacterium]